MKHIYFDNLSKNWFVVTLLILSIICLLVGIFELIPFKNPAINKGLSALGFLLQVVYFSRMFWFRNYVQWNRKGAVIKINTFLGKTITFDEVKKVELFENKIIIDKKDGSKVTFDLEDIETSDVEKLNEIIVRHALSNN